MEMDGRPILLADLGNEKVLFYKRTGSGGEGKEGDAQAGGFAPFFGFTYWNRHVYWFIKGEPDRYGGYKKEAQWLDKNIKEIPPLKSGLRLDDANKLFKSKGATLGRPKAESMGYTPIFNYSDFKFMGVIGERVGLRKLFEALELDYNYFKRTNKYPELVESYDELKEWVDPQKTPKLKYTGDALQPQKKQFLTSWVNKMNSLREELSNKLDKFKQVWKEDDWDMPEVNTKPLEYVELSFTEYAQREKEMYTEW